MGPVAWDIALYLDSFPKPGSFLRASQKIERVGGSAFNIAHGLASAGVDVGFIGYIGSDWQGKKILAGISQSRIAYPRIKEIVGESNSPIIIIDKSGERTVIAQNQSYLHELSLDLDEISPEDIVVFPLWRSIFSSELQRAQHAGCFCVVGVEACNDPAVFGAEIAIGSVAESSGKFDLARFKEVVVTNGVNGSDYFSLHQTHHQPARDAAVVDATGAGDAYWAGFLSSIARGLSSIDGMKVGSAWAALATEGYDSNPPDWRKVIERYPDVRF